MTSATHQTFCHERSRYQREIDAAKPHLNSEFLPRRQYARTITARAEKAIKMVNGGDIAGAWNHFMGIEP